jgi:hypothetical protein
LTTARFLFINKSMAIKRCPYCKAIIDEEDKYCNNCGTQLLFPEDESIEEEIPGDKIIDEEEDEEEEEEEEELLEDEGAGATKESEDLDEEEGEKALEEELEAEEAELQGEQTEEEIEEDKEEISTGVETEKWQAEGAQTEQPEGEEAQIEASELQASGEMIEEGEEEEIEILREEDKQQEEAPEPPAVRFEKSEAEKKYEVSIEEDELVFKTKDLDHLTGTVDEGKKELEEFLGSFKKAEEEKKTTPAALDESSELFQEGEAAPGTREELPPWASGMKESPPAPVSAQPPAGTGDEDNLTPREWKTDSGVGIPEKVTQKTLPFADTAAQKLEEESMRVEAPSSDEVEQRPAGFRSRLKAKLVDVVFITALWLISLWFTAQVIGVSFFRLIFRSPIPVLAFYLILLVLYFFLFLYFLGETLGDHYFSEEDEDSHRGE